MPKFSAWWGLDTFQPQKGFCDRMKINQLVIIMHKKSLLPLSLVVFLLATMQHAFAKQTKGAQPVVWEVGVVQNAALSVIPEHNYSHAAIFNKAPMTPILSKRFSNGRVIIPKKQFPAGGKFYLVVHNYNNQNFGSDTAIHRILPLLSEELNNGIVVFTTRAIKTAPFVQYPDKNSSSPFVRASTYSDFKLLANGTPLHVISSYKQMTKHKPFNVNGKVSLTPSTDQPVEWYGCDGVADWIEKDECIILPKTEYSISARLSQKGSKP